MASHHGFKLFIINLPVAVKVHFANHFLQLFIGHFLTEIGHQMTQLLSEDESITVLVEDMKHLANLFLTLCLPDLLRHHRDELGEVNRTIAYETIEGST
ncbi:hypothetical protein BV898_14104 [Hypsibius exemplaris]|uniref:Uncharacterized protein n=1 Tax=Hypsibius exemplaris TaxID=2072580 RepID=A0A1W0W8S8_HYPEX|nr:hypothetical protein BV898_14104 [Hypsibius exemplaris]